MELIELMGGGEMVSVVGYGPAAPLAAERIPLQRSFSLLFRCSLLALQQTNQQLAEGKRQAAQLVSFILYC